MLLDACVSHYLPTLADLWGVRDGSSKGGGAVTAVWLGFMMLVFLSPLNLGLDMTFTENLCGMKVLYNCLQFQTNYSHFPLIKQGCVVRYQCTETLSAFLHATLEINHYQFVIEKPFLYTMKHRVMPRVTFLCKAKLKEVVVHGTQSTAKCCPLVLVSRWDRVSIRKFLLFAYIYLIVMQFKVHLLDLWCCLFPKIISYMLNSGNSFILMWRHY